MDRFTATKKAGVFGIIGNIFLLLIKFNIGFISGSQAMIADAANSAADIFASLMTFIGNRIASEPRDENHNFGHGKAEYIFSLLISLSMIFVSFKLLLNSVTGLLNNHIFKFSWLLVFVCITTIITKLILFIYTNHLYKKHNNILIKACAKDHRNDCFATTFTLISILLSSKSIYWVDGIVGIGISIWICCTGIKIFVESYNILMDASIDDATKDIILDFAHSYKEIQKVKNVSSSPVGYQYYVTLTICVNGNMSTSESHELADNLERNISSIDKIYDTIVHVEPYENS